MKASESVKYMNINDFRELGYLQELNRRFLHPLGLALEILIDDETGGAYLSGIWDYRDDPEGMRYELNNPKMSPPARIEKFQKCAQFINEELIKRTPIREHNLGGVVEPIPGIETYLMEK